MRWLSGPAATLMDCGSCGSLVSVPVQSAMPANDNSSAHVRSVLGENRRRASRHRVLDEKRAFMEFVWQRWAWRRLTRRTAVGGGYNWERWKRARISSSDFFSWRPALHNVPAPDFSTFMTG